MQHCWKKIINIKKNPNFNEITVSFSESLCLKMLQLNLPFKQCASRITVKQVVKLATSGCVIAVLVMCANII